MGRGSLTFKDVYTSQVYLLSAFQSRTGDFVSCTTPVEELEGGGMKGCAPFSNNTATKMVKPFLFKRAGET